MKKAYLDNASTTALRPEVITEITRVLSEQYGNPSSTHSYGRSAKVILETSRKTIASLLNAEAREIIFTSGGTEADNWIIRSAVKDLGIKRIITARTEHHAVLYAAQAVAADYGITIDYVNLLPDGKPDTDHLKDLLAQNIPTLVSLMHVNNETGTITDLHQIGTICRHYKALFHSDTVQSVGKEVLDLATLPVDFIVASAHKFNGPKGVGFAYVRKNSGLKAMIYGGEQEKGMRAGTEAVHQVAGMAKALEISCKNLETEKTHIINLRNYLLQELALHFPGFKLNGSIDNNNTSTFYTIVNVMLPLPEEKTAMILFHLDMHGVAVSRGSACQSGSIKPSHVLLELLNEEDIKKPSLRISLSHYNTKDDIDILINALKLV
ncbi:cysteine desulfurase [Flavobacterium salilacus subsp. salilacus]|uniref:cysteine desulfurase family protein n=1 Tax=Flavobacterium TaxID=237 RepID=UPI00107581C4|nr:MULTISPECIES: cysteine desulfurase family protein [Flavobacterium]KAF2516285.1 cysteine desulfurase [Flavobacterium salilacus subsp. salilacus]MBE1613815.1 cysteine desulfurase [Flavobacterium sp. SaA2.13]